MKKIIVIILIFISIALASEGLLRANAWNNQPPPVCGQPKDLGTLHIESEFCSHNHLGHNAELRDGQWMCVSDDGKTTKPVDLMAVCKTEFPNATSVKEDVPGDPRTYRCWDDVNACPISPTPSPIETPNITPTPSTTTSVDTGGGSPSAGSSASMQAPVCTSGDTTQLPANPFVVRKGKDATVNFFITQGDSANIFWSVVGQPHWGNSSAGTNPDGVKPNSDNFVSYPIHDLDASQGYDFGIQQKFGCGGGKITEVIVDGPESRTFRVSYLEYSK